jgi:RNA polymerase sigma-70 factor, ECF subfamily
MNALELDERIRSLLASGEQASVRQLLVEHFDGKVGALCRGMVGNAVTAEDLKQDTFERAFAGLDSFRGESSVSTWLLRIARNRCIDHMRGSESRLVAPTGDGVANLVDDDDRSAAEIVASLQRAEHALAVLDPEDRALVLLHHVHDMSYTELADTFGTKEGALRMRMSRALAQMREMLERADARAAGADGARGPLVRPTRSVRVPRAVLWVALASLVGAFTGIWYGVIVPQKQAAAALQAQLEALEAEQRVAETSLAAAQASGASEAELQRLRDQLAQAQAAAAAGASGGVSGTSDGETVVASRRTVRRTGSTTTTTTTTTTRASERTSGGCMGPLCGLMR